MNAKVIRRGICLSIMMVLFLSAVPVISAHDVDPAPLQQASKAFSSVAKNAAPAVVFIKVEKMVETGGAAPFGNSSPFDFFNDRQPREYRQRGQGSGFIISEDGYIMTNNHVVGDADTITVKLSDGREFKAKRIGGDEKSDVAVIKIDGDNLPILPLGASDGVLWHSIHF